jgi:inner membrane protein
MDSVTHSLVGLSLTKAGLERLSPYTTTVCVLSANAPDIDFISVFFGGRWVLLQHHRGITHSIIGTLILGVLIPSILFAIERLVARWRKRSPRIQYRGLLLASLIAAATHPLMDWTNNYGVRPLLPWDGQWFYGDLVFIVDPYLLLVLGGAAFLLTSNTRWRIAGWSLLALAIMFMVLRVSPQRVAGNSGLTAARVIWTAGVLILGVARAFRVQRRVGRGLAIAALSFVVLYWSALAWAHHAAYLNAENESKAIAGQYGESLIRLAVMPTAANPFQWLSVTETDRATYRFFVSTSDNSGSPVGQVTKPERFAKPTDQTEQLLISVASRDARAQSLLGFARFPIAKVGVDDCIGQTLVQFADLRYTEPGTSRGSFSLNVPVDCPAH